MAPILKEVEAPVTATNASATAVPHGKSPNAAPARPQPIALEIPVTVNGARTVDGSDKRVPFSESTQTVLVFPHGAVIRIAAPLVPGQLVFLTNEKTKKEVVCQVVKSKSTGAAGAYVELQFTEPSPAFWGLQIPGASAAPPAPRLVPPAAHPKSAAPSAPVAMKPPVAAKPATPAAISAPPPKPVSPPPPPTVAHPAPVVAAHSGPVVPPSPVPPVSVLAPPPESAAPHPEPVNPVTVQSAPVSIVPDPLVAPLRPEPTVVPQATAVHPPAIPAPPLHDYSKEIDAIFSLPQAPSSPATPQAHPAPASSGPSSQELKLQAARLQSQLGSMLFTEVPSASPARPVASKPETPVADVAKKVVEIAHEASKPVLPVRTAAPASLGADEEVKIPSWLAPLSQNADTPVAESTDSNEASIGPPVSVNSEESYDALVAEAPHRSHSAVFGGQLLGETAAPASEVTSTGSNKGLFLGLAAAALLALGGGAWYFQQTHPGPATVAAARSTSVAPSSQEAPASNLPLAPALSTSARNNVNSTPAPSSQPPKNSAPVPLPTAAAQPKNSKPASKDPEPVELETKPSLGDVRLAAPVVNHSSGASQDSDTLQSIDTKTVPGDGDPLATATTRHNPPAAPLPIGGEVKQAQLLKSVPPLYPPIAKTQHLSGKVQIDALIDASGNVASVKVLSGPTLLHQAALDAVKQWKYSPAMLDGQPTTMHLTVTVEFRNQ